jgi:hypothetical protein
LPAVAVRRFAVDNRLGQRGFGGFGEVIMRYTLSVLCTLALSRAAVLPAEEGGRERIDFVRDVRPILQRHCYECHSAEKARSRLRLDVKAAAFRGGEAYGPSIVPGKPAESPLVRFVADPEADLRMPPEGDRPSPEEIATLTRWVAEGARWPEGVDTAVVVDKSDHWSFEPVARTVPPVTADETWPRNPIDRFVLARLEEEGLRPAPAADRRTWLRRVSFDLLGLPPSPEEVAAFLADERPDADVRVVDRLLASPRYGERWAQHWLDVVRYADTHGFEVNTPRPNAWPYRDYVIEAFNADLPYDRFVREQLAGDALGRVEATGFLVTAAALLPGQIGKDEESKRLARQDELDEMLINVGEAFLGLSVGCARCHDHMFDAITQHDYYAMQAFFGGVRYGDRPLRSADTRGNEAAEQFEAGEKGEGEAVPQVFAAVSVQPDATRLLFRGDPEQPRGVVAPAVIAALGSTALSPQAGDHDRRRALAAWITDREHPLTARVMVNRVWQGHFGTGLVETSSDFGRKGGRPSHPALLDWLASEFVRSGWSVKRLHRLVVLSATYRQSGRIDREARSRDADARLLWRFPTRRLEAEAIRDAMLATSGRLNSRPGGPGFDLFTSRGGLTGFPPVESFSGDGLRRMIYAHEVRMERDAVFGAFDCPDAGQTMPRRRRSTTPIQALNLFNSSFTIEEADAFAARVRSEVGDEEAAGIRRVYELALARPPESRELADALPVVREHGLATLCRAIFNCNEFLFLP